MKRDDYYWGEKGACGEEHKRPCRDEYEPSKGQMCHSETHSFLH